MNTRATRRLASFVIATLAMLSCLPVVSTADGQTPFANAVAVWHMADSHDSSGADSVLKIEGQVKLGIELQGAEREASLARGGDGKVAELAGGWLIPGLGAGGELNLRGQAMTMCIRLRDPSGQWNRGIFSKYGGGFDTLAYNLFSTPLVGGDGGPDIGFELGSLYGKGMIQVKTSVGQLVDPTAWHDIIVRYDGRQLEMFVDGVRVDQQPASGDLRQNDEACIVGGYSIGGKVPNPFHGQIDHAALWQRAISDDEIAKLSGGKDFVAKQKQLMQEQNQKMQKQKRLARGLAPEVEGFRDVIRSKDVAEFSRAGLALRKWMIANDPFRPLYHFAAPESWINDPNGPIYYKGRYHLFYQYDPIVPDDRGGFLLIHRCWGHAISKDLVHWEDWPVAMWPDIPQDRGGIYSGNTFIDDNGDLCALYTGNVRSTDETYGILARSTDGFVTCTKKVVMDDKQRPNPKSPVHWDGYAWKEGKTWCQLVGGCSDGRGVAWLWKSPDLEHWTLQKNIAPAIHLAGFWELPYLIPLGGRHVLMVGAVNPYWVGKYDATNMLFTPDRPAPRSIDNGNYYSFNPNMVDDKGPGGTPRRIMHGWATIGRSPTAKVPYWEHAHTIPRVLTLKDGRVWQEPIPELQTLRADKQSFKDLVVTPESGDLLKTVTGDALEIIATFKPGTAQRFGINVRSSATDPKVGVPVWFDARDLAFGAGKASMSSDLKSGDPVTLHIFVDRCIIEVYVNGNANTVAAFHNPAAQGVVPFSTGGACTLETLDVWRMKSIWD
ncbi:MAG: GH32 C-terminal domain-containing protein [Verrucomicrobia bacterium]|nr:GH32 C-terminal domain-containing protein [Verrucomicrobiota bacterium]